MSCRARDGPDRAARLPATHCARRARLLIENGAYSADEPVSTQLAAQFAVGPYRIPNVDVWTHLVYTNTQPTGSVRAPAAPTVCWGLEQHLDEVAAAIGIDPVEFRRRNLVHAGDTIGLGLIGKILRDAGLDRDQFRELLG